MKQEQFLDVVAPDVARARWATALDLSPARAETVALSDALGRVLAEAVVAPGDVPAFDRSNVDGYAVRAEDTFGADERTPAVLKIVGAPIDTGHAPEGEVRSGEARVLATGGMLPRGADAVVMVEDTEVLESGEVRISRPVIPGARLSAAGSDVGRGEVVLRAGTRLTARETGTLAACGVAHVDCHARPRVAVISTGDEIVAPGTPLAPAQVHDANARLIADAVRELGLEAHIAAIVRDDEAELERALTGALSTHDVVLLSGGTSKGHGDFTYRVVERLADIVVHGVALKPGKPLCLAAHEGRPVVVLPGFPTSAIFTFHAFVAPVLRQLAGLGADPRLQRPARVPWRITSDRGRTEFNLVNLLPAREGLLAVPLGKGSGSVTTFARADGFFAIPQATELVEAGEEVEVTLLSPDLAASDLVVVGSHCTGLDVVVARVAGEGLTVKVMSVGSRGGLETARQGACDVAPMHLYDPETGLYNHAFVAPGTRLLEGYGRRQGLAYRPEHAETLGADGDAEGVEAALRSAADDPELRLANRNPAAGTRVLVDGILEGRKPPGYPTSYRTHNAVAAAVAQGRADYGVCLEQVAHEAGLCWRPLADERYDFLVPNDRWDAPGTAAFRAAVADPEVRAELCRRGFDA